VVEREREPNSLLAPHNVGVIGVVGLVVVAGAIAWASLKVGLAWAGTTATISTNPLAVLLQLAAGDVPWPRQATYALVIITLAAAVAAVGLFVLVRWLRRRHTRVDHAARHLGRGRDIAPTSRQSVTAIAERLGVVADTPGVFLGNTVAGRNGIWASWEDMMIEIAGPRTGKTTSRAVPAIVDAPGAVIATSNKRDILDATRLLREREGDVWVFDPQQVAAEPPLWWWDPLSFVVDDDTARELAQHFAFGSRQTGARADAFFDGQGMQLLAGLLLAAARGGHPVSQVYSWVTDVNNPQPEKILRDHHDDAIAESVEAVRSSPEKQRGGVFGTAQQMAQCLSSSRVAAWVNPTVPGRLAFDPHQFVRSGGTLYSLSREGAGNAGPLVTALTVAVVKAAEDYATTCRGGRLPTPMVGILDEAANVCRWKDLPDLYSHYGSRGIVLMTILQSWAQGVECWGERGMEKLWSAANRRIYGGGVSDATFLERLSKLIGDREHLRTSVSSSKTGTSTSRQLQREQILDVAELAALPPGRAIVFSSGSRATLMESVPWMAGPHADQIRASLDQYDPGNRPPADRRSVPTQETA
jgi:type IV secretory pathway TraG/TraD family ATPase VirD4